MRLPIGFSLFYSILNFFLVFGAGSAVQAQSGENIGSLQQELRGGIVITGFQGVVEFTRTRPDLGQSLNSGCTGTMIAPDVVLTAAHCFDRVDGQGGQNNPTGIFNFTIFYHDPDDGRRQVFTGNANWFVSAAYRGANLTSGPGDANADIGVIQIAGRFANTDYRDYSRLYSDRGAVLERKLRAYGAGRFTYSGRTDNLLRNHWFEVESVARNHIVVDNRDKVTTCIGDSGGPLMFTATSNEGGIATITGVLSQQEVDTDGEGNICANNDRPFNDSFYSRTNWAKTAELVMRAGLTCPLMTRASKNYRRCFSVPFINDAPVEGHRRKLAVALMVASMI